MFLLSAKWKTLRHDSPMEWNGNCDTYVTGILRDYQRWCRDVIFAVISAACGPCLSMQFSRVYRVSQTCRMSFQQQIPQIKRENGGRCNFEKSVMTRLRKIGNRGNSLSANQVRRMEMDNKSETSMSRFQLTLNRLFPLELCLINNKEKMLQCKDAFSLRDGIISFLALLYCFCRCQISCYTFSKVFLLFLDISAVRYSVQICPSLVLSNSLSLARDDIN